MGMINPIWLWGMAGLVIPVVIHFLSRKDMRIIRIGSLRHLEQAPTRQAIRIHLNDYLLLAIRCLIIVIIALLLSGVFLKQQETATRWVLVERGLAHHKPWATLLDSLASQQFEIRSLEKGFPLIEPDTQQEAMVPDYWSLVSELNGLRPDRCIVISRSRLAGYAGKRPGLNTDLTWITTDGDSTSTILASLATSGDSLIDLVEHSNSYGTSFETVRQTRAGSAIGSRITERPAPVRVIVSGTSVRDEERRVIHATLRAIATNGLVRVEVVDAPSADLPPADWLIWLSPDDPPRHSIPNVITKAASGRPAPENTCWTISVPLTAGSAYEGQLTLRLAGLLLRDVTAKLTRMADRHDQRVMPDAAMFASDTPATSKRAAARPKQKDLSHVLALCLLLLLATERILANRQQL